MPTVDICVIGAGPAGCIAARDLAEQGFHVLVLEEHPTIGAPVDCSGVIGTEAFEKLGLPSTAICDTLQAIEFVSPSGKQAVFHPHRPLASIVDRAAFDVVLAERARLAGAKIFTNSRASRMCVSRDAVQLTVQRQGTETFLSASAVVLAHGPRYDFQQYLGMGKPAKYLRTVQAEIEIGRRGTTRIFLGSKVAPGSFAWWLPMQRGTKRLAKIGVSALWESQRAFQAFLQVLRERGDVTDREILFRSWMIPIAPLPRTFSDRILAVGDAAGQTKPTTGGGLYYGLLCAKIGAEVLGESLRFGDVSARRLAQYEQRWRGILGRELATAHRFRRFFERLSDMEIDHLFDVMSQDGLIRDLQETANFDWHRQIILQGFARLPAAAMLLARFRRRQVAELLS